MEPSSIGLNVAPELGLHGDVATVLDQLTEAWDAKPKDAWLQTAKQGGEQMHQTWLDLGKVEGSPVPPGRVPAAIVEEAGRDAILISDGGDIHTWCVTTFPAFRPGSLLTTHDSLGTIGVGMPYALGAKAAAPDRPVVMCIGDGSFGFGAMELETAARNSLPFVVVIANNGEWGNIRHVQGAQGWHGEIEAIDLTLTFLRSKRDQARRAPGWAPSASACQPACPAARPVRSSTR